MVAIDEPQLLLDDFGDAGQRPQWLEESPSSAQRTREVDFEMLGVDSTTSSILLDIEKLSRRYIATGAYASAEEAVSVLSHLCSDLQQLLRLGGGAGAGSMLDPVSESCRFGAALHVFSPLSGYYPDPTLVSNTLVHRLKASLTSLMLSVGMGNPLLLWLLSVGGVSAPRMPERGWFVGHLVVVVGDLNIQSWAEMRQSLMRVTWHDSICEMSYGNLYQEVVSRAEALKLADSE